MVKPEKWDDFASAIIFRFSQSKERTNPHSMTFTGIFSGGQGKIRPRPAPAETSGGGISLTLGDGDVPVTWASHCRLGWGRGRKVWFFSFENILDSRA